MSILGLIVGLSWIWIPLLIIWLLTRGKKDAPSKPAAQNTGRDQMWLDYLASYRTVVKTAKEKRLLEALIEGSTADEFVNSPTKTPQTFPSSKQLAEYEQAPTAKPTPAMATSVENQAPAKISQPIDNTILLLYFGAFLLVASVGLFVAIGDLGGLTRTIIVGITAAVLYLGGLWLYTANKKLAQAGISFIGTGMMVAPLTGVAWYNLVADQSNAGLIWLVTSLACIALYIHAFSKIKNGFIAYLLIGSFVSSIESAVLTIDLPAYGYAWGLIVAGLLLTTSNRLRGQPAELAQASDTSAQLLIPLSVVGSVILLPEFGSLQLSVTMFLSGCYYALLAASATERRQSFAVAAQLSFISSATSLAYWSEESLLAAGITLIAISSIYCAAIAYTNQQTLKSYSLIELASLAVFVGSILCISEPWALVAGLSVSTLLSGIVWQKLHSDESLQVMGLLLISIPFVGGLYAAGFELASWEQLSLCLGSLAIIGVLVVVACTKNSYKAYYNSSSMLYVMAATALLIPSGAIDFLTLSAAVAGIVLSFAAVHRMSKDSNWLVGSGVATFVPLTYALFEYGIDDIRFTVAVAAALLWNIGVSLATRESLVRWMVVVCILIAPFAIGGGGLGFHWSYAGYAGGYLLAMGSCILARAIARGKLLVSAKVPISSYYTEASQAYVTGYSVAAVISIIVSLYDEQSQLITTLILGVMALAIAFISRMEQKNQLIALLPFVAQAALLSGLRPDLDNASLVGITALASTFVALCTYGIAVLMKASDTKAADSTRLASVLAAYIAPGLAFTQTDPSLLLPISLFVAGLLTFDYNKTAPQVNKELSLGVCIAAVLWMVYLAGYTNIHIHTHLLAVFFAGFAMWRSNIGDSKGSLGYVQALFFVVTVPLALQSLSGDSGGPYGLLLIGEQVFFMIAGAMLAQRFLLRWGLWTALAAILFQLRGLGWAFLTLLAIIIISVAVYRLQKHPPDNAD